MIGATMAYTLDEKRKRKEEETKQRDEAYAKAAQRNAAEEQRKVNGWLEGQAMLNAYLEEAKKQGASDKEIAKLKQTGATQGLSEAIKEAEAKVQTLSAQNVARQQALENFLAQERDSAVAEAWQKQKQAEDLQAGLAAYYNARKQGEQESETNWWEKTKSFVNEKIVQQVYTAIASVTSPAPSVPVSTSHVPRFAKPTLVPVLDDDPPKKTWWDWIKDKWAGFVNWLSGNERKPPMAAPTPNISAIQTQVVQTVVAQITQTAQGIPTSTPIAPTFTPTATSTNSSGTPMVVFAEGINLRLTPSILAPSVFHDERSILRGSTIYIDSSQPMIIRDGFCWVPATYIDPTINIRAIAASPQFFNPLIDFMRWTAHGQPITYSNGLPSPWGGTHLGDDYVQLPGGNRNPTIQASAPGIVVNSGEQSGGYGNYVIIEYPNASLSTIQRLSEYQEKPGSSLYAIYAHLLNNMSPILPAGNLVNAGTPIGNMGKSGNAGDFVHLHLELRIGEPNQELNASNGDWYKPEKVLPIDPALVFTPNDTWNGWVAQYQCTANGQPVGESYLGSHP
ncbi:MAG: peptidoglycan DD-metalloendopeptidase family protein [Anaerolineales bacterium]|nr:peptidoglycan DD-metalloendopeptidase family protein [Anaerolineales bacterium]